MTSILFLFCSCLATLASTRTAPEVFLREHADIHFERFIQVHNKQYIDEEEKQARLEIFIDNLERINVLNQQSNHAVFGVTKFSDLTPDEFVNHFTGLGDAASFNLSSSGCNDVYDSQIPNYNAPDSFDWRQHNAVTRVKNQYQCGGCYAFSVSGNIESQYAIKHGRLVELSEQQTVDCDRNSNGCQGGYMTTAFRAIIQQGGIETEADYPYVGTQQVCQFYPGKAAVRVTDCNLYNIRSQEKLKQLLYKYGPISIDTLGPEVDHINCSVSSFCQVLHSADALGAFQYMNHVLDGNNALTLGLQATNFQYYHGGIMSDQLCNADRVNHAVLLVGYGIENGTPYWIIKNSWAESFGELGYIRIQRGEQASSCGMMNNGLMSSAIIM